MLAAVPPTTEMQPARFWRWCIARTIRDLRASAQRGRPISRPNLRRLFQRRWSNASGHVGTAEHWTREVGGCSIVDTLYAAELRVAEGRRRRSESSIHSRERVP